MCLCGKIGLLKRVVNILHLLRELLLSLHNSWPRGRLLQGSRVALRSLPLQKSGSLQKGEEHNHHTAGK